MPDLPFQQHALTSVYADPEPGVSWRDYVDQRWSEHQRALLAAMASSTRALEENSRLSAERLEWLRREQATVLVRIDANAARIEFIWAEAKRLVQNAQDLGAERMTLVQRETDLERSRMAKALEENARASDQRMLALRAESEAVRLGADRAIQKSEVATELRFQSVNEFRAQLQDQQTAAAATHALLLSQLMPREVAESQFGEIRKQLAALTTRMDTTQGKALGASSTVGYFVAAATLLISFVVVIANHSFG